MPTKKALLLMILGVAFMFTGKVYAEQKVFINSKGVTHNLRVQSFMEFLLLTSLDNTDAFCSLT